MCWLLQGQRIEELCTSSGSVRDSNNPSQRQSCCALVRNTCSWKIVLPSHVVDSVACAFRMRPRKREAGPDMIASALSELPWLMKVAKFSCFSIGDRDPLLGICLS